MKELKENELPKEMLEAFQRIEEKVQKEAMTRAQAERDAELLLRMREVRRRRMLERIALGVTLMFSVLIMVVAWYSRDRAAQIDPVTGLPIVGDAKGGGDGQSQVDCSDPRLRLTKFCREKNQEVTESSWNSISRGDGKPFTLHQNKDTSRR